MRRPLRSEEIIHFVLRCLRSAVPRDEIARFATIGMLETLLGFAIRSEDRAALQEGLVALRGEGRSAPGSSAARTRIEQPRSYSEEIRAHRGSEGREPSTLVRAAERSTSRS